MASSDAAGVSRPGDRRRTGRCDSIRLEVREAFVQLLPLLEAGGDLRVGHWSYAVAWDGQMGFTINYAEDLLRSACDSRKFC